MNMHGLPSLEMLKIGAFFWLNAQDVAYISFLASCQTEACGGKAEFPSLCVGKIEVGRTYVRRERGLLGSIPNSLRCMRCARSYPLSLDIRTEFAATLVKCAADFLHEIRDQRKDSAARFN